MLKMLSGVVDKPNTIFGAIATTFATVLGQEWFLFVLFLLFNVLDWLTGVYKARKLEKENSQKGWSGVLKKLMYWVIIAVAFALPQAFMPLGEIIGTDLSFLLLIGWMTMAMLMVNEARSILENLVEAGIHVPHVLVKGLSVTAKLLESKIEKEEDKEGEQ